MILVTRWCEKIRKFSSFFFFVVLIRAYPIELATRIGNDQQRSINIIIIDVSGEKLAKKSVTRGEGINSCDYGGRMSVNRDRKIRIGIKSDFCQRTCVFPRLI